MVAHLGPDRFRLNLAAPLKLPCRELGLGQMQDRTAGPLAESGQRPLTAIDRPRTKIARTHVLDVQADDGFGIDLGAQDGSSTCEAVPHISHAGS